MRQCRLTFHKFGCLTAEHKPGCFRYSAPWHIMQLFGLNCCAVLAATGDDPTMCDQHVIKMPTEACQLAWSVAYALDVQWRTDRVQGPLGRMLEPWKSLSKGHLQHECFLWALANPHHLHWVIRHGLALCREYTKRFLGRIHATEWQLRHLARHFGVPNGKSTMTPDDFIAWMRERDPGVCNRKFPDMSKFCTVNPPNGCVFGILAGPDNIGNDWVASYTQYYKEKQESFKKPMRFTKRAREDTEEQD